MNNDTIELFAGPGESHVHSNRGCARIGSGWEGVSLRDARDRGLRVCSCVNEALGVNRLHRYTLSHIAKLVISQELELLEPEESLEPEEKTHSFGPCVRFENMTWDESHPCYLCGFPIPVMIEYCECGIIKCPECGSCACPSSMDRNVFDALIKLRNRYCCNPINFAGGIDFSKDADLLLLVPNYPKALAYCRNLEIESAKRG